MRPTKRAMLVRAIRAERLCLLAFPLVYAGIGPLIPGTPLYRWTMARRKPICDRIQRLEAELSASGPVPKEFRIRPETAADKRIRRQYRDSETPVMV
jgi:hypothetical protein